MECERVTSSDPVFRMMMSPSLRVVVHLNEAERHRQMLTVTTETENRPAENGREGKDVANLKRAHEIEPGGTRAILPLRPSSSPSVESRDRRQLRASVDL